MLEKNKALNGHIAKKPTRNVSLIIRACKPQKLANNHLLTGMTSVSLNVTKAVSIKDNYDLLR